MASRPRSMNAGGENPEFIVRDFTHGVHNFAAREAINDEEFWWCENVMPLASGNLANVPKTSAVFATSNTEAGTLPSFVCGFNLGGTPYAFAAFAASGNGYIVNLSLGIITKIINGLLSSQGLTYATQYGNLGLLIIDPNGYWDYNVTTANTLTAWNNTIIGATINTGVTSIAGNTQLKQILTTPGGTGANFHVNYQVISVIISAAGTGYVIGDTLSLIGNSPLAPAQIVVTAVGGGGTITGISLTSGGSYPGPTSTTLGPVGPPGTAPNVVGGTGTGAAFTVAIQAIGAPGQVTGVAPQFTNNTSGFTLNIQGSGYNSTFAAADETAGNVTITPYTVFASGVIGGQGIATYAGRVWISSSRTIYFTEVGTYNNFGGSGSFFTITDAYLFNKITVLFSANNYLYIFGPTSIDALSNVTVIAGVAAFSRINIVQGVGTTSPTSVFGYYRGVCFYDPSGFYILTGASPEKISESITNIVGRNAQQLINTTGNIVYGGVLNFNQELCACFSFTFFDNVSQLATKRAITAIYFRRRWWFYATGLGFPTGGISPVISVVSPTTNLPTLYAIGQVSGSTWGAYIPLGGASSAAWQVKTKFWDAHAPFHIKQAINAAIGAVFTGGANSGITITVDTDLGSSLATSFPVKGTPSTYQMIVNQVNEGGGQYVGLTVNGDGTDTSQVNILALRGKQEANLLE